MKECQPDGGIRRFLTDANGNVVKVIESEEYEKKKEEGTGISYEYDVNNRLTVIRNAKGELVKKYSYDRHGRIQKEVIGDSYQPEKSEEEQIGTLYRYNLAGWLLEKREPVEQDGESIFYKQTLYEYDKEGNCIRERRGREAVTEKEAAATYLTLQFCYDKDNRLIQVTDSLGAAMEYAYDCLNQKRWERMRINENTKKVVYYQYDAVGRIEKLVELAERKEEETSFWKEDWRHASTTTYAYDRNGNLIRIGMPEGSEILREYDWMDRLKKETQRDRKQGICRSTYYFYDRAGNCIEKRDGKGSIFYTYDRRNQCIKRMDREGGITRIFYNKNGKIEKVIDAENYEREGEQAKGTTYTYDEFGRIQTVRNALGYLEEKNFYHLSGKLVKKEKEEGIFVSYVYDLAGRLKEVGTAEGEEKGIIRQSYQYERNGSRIGSKDGEGNQTEYELDEWGRIVGIRKPDGSQEQYTYDYAGNITITTDGRGGTIRYHYNYQNQVDEIRDQVGEKDIFDYDKEGRLSYHKNRNQEVLTYHWNFDQNLVEKQAEAKGERKKEAFLYRYNQNGELVEASGGGIQYRYDYTPNGKLKTKYVEGRPVFYYTYIKTGKQKTITDHSGKVTEYRYDVLNRPVEIWDNGQRIVEYTYDRANRLKEVRFANGVVTKYTYDRDQNLTSLITLGKQGECFLSYTYCYDGNGNRILKEGKTGSLFSGRIRYQYDCLQRLESVISSEGKRETFSYDEAGNRLTQKSGKKQEFYRYDSRNRLVERIERNDSTPTFSIQYHYDAQGNLLEEVKKKQKIIPFQKKRYDYNGFQQMKRVEKEDIPNQKKEWQENKYDAENLRYQMEENGESTQFLTDGWQILTEVGEKDQEKKRLIRGYGIVASEEREYHTYHTNEHGDVELILGGKGEIENQYQYDAFGRITKAEEFVGNRYTYVGEVYDSLTMQYYLRARYYNPQIARFTQEDEYRGDGLNLYAYCANNPVRYIDPSGYGEQSVNPQNPLCKKEDNDKKTTDFIPYTDEMRKYIIVPENGYQAYLERQYIEIRKMGLEDVDIIAKNTGLSRQEVIELKLHLFLTTHPLSHEGQPLKELYFQADPEIAYGWNKALQGELLQDEKDWFRELANHELTESKYMKEGMVLRDPSTYVVGKGFDENIEKNAHDKANVTARQPNEFPRHKGYKEFNEYFSRSATDY